MTLGRRRFLQSALALPLLAAQRPPPGVDWNKWFHDWFGRDFGMTSYYADDNAKLLASHEPVDVVFLGDSVTEGWHDKRPGFFTRGRINRGIGGQTSSQMVLRMYSDVVALRPRAVGSRKCRRVGGLPSSTTGSNGSRERAAQRGWIIAASWTMAPGR
jgi:hypothetical protein